MRADKAARDADPRIFQCAPGTLTSSSHSGPSAPTALTLLIHSRCRALRILPRKEGTKHLARQCGGGGRVGIEYFQTEKTPEHFAKEAARQAIIQPRRG